MTEERADYDVDGTCEIETLELLHLVANYWRDHGCEFHRAIDLHRRVMAGQVYVGAVDWPVEEVG